MLRSVSLFLLITAASLAVPYFYATDPAGFERWLAGFGDAGTDGRVSELRMAAEAEAPTPVQAAAPLGRKVRLAADQRGHFSGEFRLNGRSVPAMVDTGATTVAINRSTARRIGLQLAPSDFRYQVNTANGPARAAGAVIRRLEIGRIAVEDVDAVVLEDAALNGTLIGMSFLNRLSKVQVEDGSLMLVQ